jgi:hypothetical protein
MKAAMSAARQELDLLVGDLSTVCGQLEEFATMWRRQCQARNSWLDMPHAFPQGLREAPWGDRRSLREHSARPAAICVTMSHVRTRLRTLIAYLAKGQAMTVGRAA